MKYWKFIFIMKTKIKVMVKGKLPYQEKTNLL